MHLAVSVNFTAAFLEPLTTILQSYTLTEVFLTLTEVFPAFSSVVRQMPG